MSNRRRYKPKYEVEVKHEGLNKYRHITGSDAYVVERKARAQLAQWEEQWARQEDRERIAGEREARRRELAEQREEALALASERTIEAQNILNNLTKILEHTLSIHDAIDWNNLKDTCKFSEEPPAERMLPAPAPIPLPKQNFPFLPEQPGTPIKPDEPSIHWSEFQPVFTFFDRLIPVLGRNKERAMRQKFSSAHAAWSARCAEIDHNYGQWKEHCKKVMLHNAQNKAAWEDARRKAKEAHDMAMLAWSARKRNFEENQSEKNAIIDAKREQYFSGDHGAILDYCDMVLSNSVYPDFFPQGWEIDYTEENKTLILNYVLPSIDDLPTLKSVQYVQSRKEFKETHLSAKEKSALYDSLLYQIALRTIHELYEADVVDVLDTIAFNGMVTSLDRASGNEVTACVLSVLTRKDAFLKINLANIDPKICFKSLKGVAATTLANMAPVAPILVMDREDKRFIPGNEVLGDLCEETNLASMPWEDFEHLIREVFEQEFATGGGEVKVTRASRDGGVDAIAFDPDPIRGGKIVIQAKRYTNTVGVAAVRDLYGTVINEGAIKGVLVTTATYGPDAYEFAQGKPLTLLNGSNLLHLLERHGHKARIDIQKARKTT